MLPDGTSRLFAVDWPMKLIHQAQVTSHGGRRGHIEATDQAVTADFSRAAPGGAKPTPEHLFAGAYAACFFGALTNAAQRNRVSLSPDATLTATVRLLEEDDGSYLLSVDLRAHLPHISSDQASELLHAAHQTCPYSRAVRGNIGVTLSLD